MNERKFKRYYKKLREEHMSLSFTNTNSEYYQAILREGKEVLPLIFHELRKDPNWELLSLIGEITKLNIVPEESRGKLDEITEIFLKWADENEYELNIFDLECKDVLFKYEDSILDGFVHTFSDSKKYVKIDKCWYETEKIEVLDTTCNIDKLMDEKLEEVPKSQLEKEEEKRKIRIEKDLKGTTILYRRNNDREGRIDGDLPPINQGIVENVSPEEFYIQIGNSWYLSNEILILEILENKLEEKVDKSTWRNSK